MSLPKRHHVVPEMILKHFANEHGAIYLLDKRRSVKDVISTQPKNALVEAHLYSEIDDAGVKNPWLEKQYASVENSANEVVNKIIEAARVNRRPNLTRVEKELWDDFFHHQWKRSPDFFEGAMTPEAFGESLERAIQNVESEVRALKPDERAYFADKENRERLRRNTRIKALAGHGTLVSGELATSGLAVARIVRPNRSLVIGSRCVIRIEQLGFADTSSRVGPQIWMPIAWDVAVGPSGQANTEAFIPVNDDRRIRTFNETMFAASMAIVGRSRSLVESLARRTL